MKSRVTQRSIYEKPQSEGNDIASAVNRYKAERKEERNLERCRERGAKPRTRVLCGRKTAWEKSFPP